MNNALTNGYNHTTGELVGETLCRYCGGLARIIPDLRPADWHSGAGCVAGEEPIPWWER